MIQNVIKQYIAELNRLFKAGKATEHSYRPALLCLLETLVLPLQVTNEPKRIECGAPDYIVTKGEIPVGYIEAKDLGADLNHRQYKEQFERYIKSLNNLIITDYLTFKWYVNGNLHSQATIGTVTEKSIVSLPADTFSEIITEFANRLVISITTSEHLSKVMASKAKLMAKIIENSFNGSETESACTERSRSDTSIYAQMTSFREVLIPNITPKEFSDIYAQTIAYGMFAAKLNSAPEVPFNRSAAANLIPHSNPFLRRLFHYIAGFDLDERISWVVDDLADLFNHVDISAIVKEFSKAEHDPIIHFYETFLTQYDPVLRKNRGVWYTPQPIVKFIVQAIDDILKSDFSIPQGLADASIINKTQQISGKDSIVREEQRNFHKVQILEPATGTGTFITEIINLIYSRFKNKQGVWQDYANNHLYYARLYYALSKS